MNINIGINNSSFPFNFCTSTFIPVSSASVLLMIASKPPNTRINIHTSIASANPLIGAIRTCERLAPTVPLPFTITLSTKVAFGSMFDNIPSPNIRIRIIEKDDNIALVFFLDIFNFLLL